MSGRTIAKIIFLIIMSICALISIGAGFIASAKMKKAGNKTVSVNRNIVRIRMFCFLGCCICLLICVII